MRIQTRSLPARSVARGAIGAFAVFFLLASTTIAQSTTRRAPATTRQPAQAGSGSTTQGSATVPGSSTNSAQVGLNGYCPVCILEMKKWVKGDPRYTVTYDGKTYMFPGEEQRQMFLKDPAKYVPAMGGYCTVCKVEMNKAVPGSVYYAAIHKGRLYLFPGEEQKQMFLKNPAKYANADLALGGNCPVCRVEMKQENPGKPQYTVFFNNMRYQFPNLEHRDMFLKNPAKYVSNSN